MKKSVLLFLLSLLIVPIAFADMSIQTDQNIYNLGDKIKVSASVLRDKDFEGFFKLTLSCGNYKLQNYFSNTVNLEANFRTAIPGLDFAELPVKSPMLGNCIITGDLLTNDNLVIEERNSNNFGVTSQLSVLPVKTKITALPGDSILISGVINEAFGNNVLKASVKIMLDDSSYTVEAVDGKFNLTLEIPKNIKSGKHTIEISASDTKVNTGSSSNELEITAVPSYIKTELSNDKLLPGSKTEILASLYDQADDLINDSLDLELKSPAGNKVFGKVVQSNDKLDYEFSQYAEPGAYLLTSAYNNLLNKVSINITTVREVKIKYENESVFVENVGNVPFEDELTFLLESGQKKYPLTKKVNIEPGKLINIELSKEVPLGIYSIGVPLKEGIGINETIQAVAGYAQGLGNLLSGKENLLAADVTIHDNRPIYKKIVSSLDSISSELVGSDGLLARNPLLAPMILVGIVLLIVLRYGRKPIMMLIKRKKEDAKDKDDKI